MKKDPDDSPHCPKPFPMVKEDAARRAGRADDVKGEYPKLIEQAQLAIDDTEESYEDEGEELEEYEEGEGNA